MSWISGLILREPQVQQDLATKMAGYSDLGNLPGNNCQHICQAEEFAVIFQ